MRRPIKSLATAIAFLAIGFAIPAEAGFIGMPRTLINTVEPIRLDAPALPPFAYTEFCNRYKTECERPRRMVFRGGKVRMDFSRWAELVIVNQKVNNAIRPERYTGSVIGEQWLIAPERGDCNDYAVTKRHELIKRGWAARNVLLSEVVTRSGEHHLVVVVRTNKGDLVLDNLTQTVKVWTKAPYQWVRIQRPDHDKLWATISVRSV